MDRQGMIISIRKALSAIEADQCDDLQFQQIVRGLLVDLVLALNPEQVCEELARLDEQIKR